MKKLSLLAIMIAAALVGCGGPATAPGTVKNAEGETEGQKPTFVSVPAQNDPAYKK